MKYREADLHYIYVRVGTQNKSIAEMTGREFPDWVLSKVEQYHLQGFDFDASKKLETINRLAEKGVVIYMIKREARHEWDKGLKQKKSP